MEADPPVGAGPSFAAPDPASLLNQLLGMTDSERGLLQLVAPLLALPSPPGQGDPPPGPEDALTSGPPAGAPDPPSLNRGCPPPGRADALVDCPPLEILSSTSEVDPHPPEAMETSVAGDPPAGIAGPLSPPAEQLVGVDSHMHLDRCFSRRHGFGCSGRTLSDLRQHVMHLTGEEPPLRLRVVIANFCDERQWSGGSGCAGSGRLPHHRPASAGRWFGGRPGPYAHPDAREVGSPPVCGSRRDRN